MKRDEFETVLNTAIGAMCRTLSFKASLYAPGDNDRLCQFKMAGAAQGINPMEALRGMMAKHFTAFAMMCEHPIVWQMDRWDEVLGDLRNYTVLADALIRDISQDIEDK